MVKQLHVLLGVRLCNYYEKKSLLTPYLPYMNFCHFNSFSNFSSYVFSYPCIAWNSLQAPSHCSIQDCILLILSSCEYQPPFHLKHEHWVTSNPFLFFFLFFFLAKGIITSLMILLWASCIEIVPTFDKAHNFLIPCICFWIFLMLDYLPQKVVGWID